MQALCKNISNVEFYMAKNRSLICKCHSFEGVTANSLDKSLAFQRSSMHTQRQDDILKY